MGVGKPCRETHLEAQQNTQVPGWHILDLVQHVKLGVCGQGDRGIPRGIPCGAQRLMLGQRREVTQGGVMGTSKVHSAPESIRWPEWHVRSSEWLLSPTLPLRSSVSGLATPGSLLTFLCVGVSPLCGLLEALGLGRSGQGDGPLSQKAPRGNRRGIQEG